MSVGEQCHAILKREKAMPPAHVLLIHPHDAASHHPVPATWKSHKISDTIIHVPSRTDRSFCHPNNPVVIIASFQAKLEC